MFQASTQYDNSTDLRRSILLAAVLSPAFAALFVGLRFYTARGILRVGIHKDDWLILAALVCTIGYSISEYFHVKRGGLGLHYWEIEDRAGTMRMYIILSAFPIAILNNLVTLFTKASILCFYLRFSVSKWFKIAVYFVLAIVIGYCLAGGFAFVYACTPIYSFWDTSYRGPKKCIDINAWYATLVSLNVATDAIILALPIWILRPLRAGLSQKAAIAGILGTGGFVLGVSLFRLYITLDYAGDRDALHRYGVNYLWLMIEINVAIICACLPCLRALAGRVMPSLLAINQQPQRLNLNTIQVTQNRDTMTNNSDCFNVTVMKSTCSGTMWFDSRPSSMYSQSNHSQVSNGDHSREAAGDARV
ncbi:hypothetical protein OQA88_3518 [Cercophora sp. LCS_1]